MGRSKDTKTFQIFNPIRFGSKRIAQMKKNEIYPDCVCIIHFVRNKRIDRIKLDGLMCLSNDVGST
jgi:hypothetical protein